MFICIDNFETRILLSLIINNTFIDKKINHKKKASSFDEAFVVVPPRLELGLFCTKNRRVASYTMGQLTTALILLKASCGGKSTNKIPIVKQ